MQNPWDMWKLLDHTKLNHKWPIKMIEVPGKKCNRNLSSSVRDINLSKSWNSQFCLWKQILSDKSSLLWNQNIYLELRGSFFDISNGMFSSPEDASGTHLNHLLICTVYTYHIKIKAISVAMPSGWCPPFPQRPCNNAITDLAGESAMCTSTGKQTLTHYVNGYYTCSTVKIQ